jgi:hypothetical protein
VFIALISREQVVKITGCEEAFQSLLPTLWVEGLNLSDTPLNLGWSKTLHSFVLMSPNEVELERYLRDLDIARPLPIAA